MTETTTEPDGAPDPGAASHAGTCHACGQAARGNFCSHCGTRLGGPASCPGCGSEVKPDAAYCAQCGQPLRAVAAKPTSARMPWILSGVALVAFSLMVAFMVQRQAGPRAEGMPPTGSIPGAEPTAGTVPGGTGAGAVGAGMPSAEELASMPPRQAADRLFERAMAEHEGGDIERAAFFADMGVQAYGMVPREEIDADARFHVGLLQMLRGNAEASVAAADTILASDPDHLLGLILALRTARFQGEEAEAEALEARFRAAGSGADLTGLPEYRAHRALIERQLEELGGTDP